VIRTPNAIYTVIKVFVIMPWEIELKLIKKLQFGGIINTEIKIKEIGRVFL
jgi:hypothetical protein